MTFALYRIPPGAGRVLLDIRRAVNARMHLVEGLQPQSLIPPRGTFDASEAPCVRGATVDRIPPSRTIDVGRFPYLVLARGHCEQEVAAFVGAVMQSDTERPE